MSVPSCAELLRLSAQCRHAEDGCCCAGKEAEEGCALKRREMAAKVGRPGRVGIASTGSEGNLSPNETNTSSVELQQSNDANELQERRADAQARKDVAMSNVDENVHCAQVELLNSENVEKRERLQGLYPPPDVNEMALKRCGPILEEFPQLGEMFEPEARDASQQWLHRCAKCAYSSHNKTTLLYHVIGIHLEITPFLCTQGCGLTTASYSNLRQHELRVHKVPYNRNSATTPDYHVCSGCKLRFRAPLTLLHHYLKAHHTSCTAAAQRRSRARPEEQTSAHEDSKENERRKRVKQVMSLSNIAFTQTD